MENKDFYDTGFELESYKFDLRMARDLLNANGIIVNRNVCLDYSKYNVMTEEHISYDDHNSRHYNIYGGEVISPIIHDKKTLLESLKNVCDVVKETGGKMFKDSSCGFHIHISRDVIPSKEILNRFLIFNFVYSGVIYNLAKGDSGVLRDSIDLYASPIRKKILEDFIKSEGFDLVNKMLSFKNYYVRLSKATIEDRHFNASLNNEILEGYYDYLIRVFNYIHSDYYDKEELDYLFQYSNDDNSLIYNDKLYGNMESKLSLVRGLK